ncbi:hypothetical protein ACJJIU_10415 [Microbulbifer sp. CnH-101-E]|uniref:hypothetical protein n=1 Tax=unclassified Microbulbifer TaxID=2619833 RepID=UPI00403A57DE
MSKKNLGTLSVDLVAKTGGFEKGLGKAEQRTEKWERTVRRSVSAVSKAFAAGTVAVAGALAVMTARVVEQSGEIENLSAVANTSTEEFQRMTYAAQRYGVEQDKVADILKDTSDKVGDFLQNSGGPLKDFFDNIAPQVGVTAEEFRHLSGRDALGLYVKSLEKANLSQNEMTFYMEAIASDATLLLPLLRNNASELNRLGDEAQDVGAVLSDLDLQQLGEVRENLDELKGALDGFEKEVVTGALPAIKDLTELIQDEKTQAAFSALTTALINVGSAAASAVVELVEFTQEASKSVARMVHGESEILKLDRSLEQLSATINSGVIGDGKLLTGIRLATGEYIHQGTSVDDLREKLAALQKQRDAFFGTSTKTDFGDLLGDDFRAVIADLEKEFTAAAKVIDGELLPPVDHWLIFNEVIEELGTEFKTAKEEAEALQRNQEAYAGLLRDLRTDEEVLTDQMRERLAIVDAMAGLTEEQRASTLGRIADTVTEDGPTLGGLDSGEDIEAARTELEDWYSTQLQMLEQFRSERADLNATWDEEELSLRQQYEERLTEISLANEDLRRQQQLDGYSLLMQVASDYYSGMEGEEAAYMRAALSIGGALLDEKKRNALQSVIANTQDAAMGAYNAMASIPYIGPVLGAAAAGAVYVTGGLAAAKITGMAHDGIDAVPEDGTWLLQKGERVTTSETSAKLDRTLAMIQADMHSGGGGGDYGRPVSMTQNIRVDGTVNNRTATQLARESERKQRINRMRLGS